MYEATFDLVYLRVNVIIFSELFHGLQYHCHITESFLYTEHYTGYQKRFSIMTEVHKNNVLSLAEDQYIC